MRHSTEMRFSHESFAANFKLVAGRAGYADQFEPLASLSKFSFKILKSYRFDFIVLAAIGINTILLALEYFEYVNTHVHTHVHTHVRTHVHTHVHTCRVQPS
jgi:hypothetical protein